MPSDRLFFKIVPKTKIPQHLEKGMVAGSASHILNVIGANTFLGSRGTGGGGVFLSKENRLKGQHSGNG